MHLKQLIVALTYLLFVQEFSQGKDIPISESHDLGVDEYDRNSIPRNRDGKLQYLNIYYKRVAANHPTVAFRNREVEADFPAYVYGKDVIKLWVHYMRSLPALVNTLVLVSGLRDGSISPLELANQLLKKNVNYSHISKYYETRSIGGWDHQREFEELVAKRKVRNIDVGILNEIANTTADLFRKQVANEFLQFPNNITTFLEVFKNIQNNYNNFTKLVHITPGLNVSEFYKMMSSLNEVAAMQFNGSLKDPAAVVQWFETNKGNIKIVENFQNYSRQFLKLNERLDYSFKFVDIFSTAKNLFAAANKIIKNKEEIARKIDYLEDVMDDLRMLCKNRTTIGLLGWLEYVKVGVDSILETDNKPPHLLPGLPLRKKSIRHVLKEYRMEWISALARRRLPLVQLEQLFAPMEIYLEYFSILEVVLEKISRNNKIYKENYEKFMVYLKNVNRIRDELPNVGNGSFFGNFTIIKTELSAITHSQNVDFNTLPVSKYRVVFDEINRVMGSQKELVDLLRRCGDSDVLKAFEHKNLTITDAQGFIQKTIGYIGFAQLTAATNMIKNSKYSLFYIPRKLMKALNDINLDDLTSSLNQMIAVINKTGIISAFQHISDKVDTKNLLLILESSRTIWEYENLEYIWEGVYALQEFLQTRKIFGELQQMSALLHQHHIKRDDKFDVGEVFAKNYFSLYDVNDLVDGLNEVEKMYIFYDLKIDMDFWDNAIKTTSFRSESDAELNLLRLSWKKIYNTFNNFRERLVILEHRLYSPPPNETFSDHIKTVNTIWRIETPFFEVFDITNHLIKKFPNSVNMVKNLERLHTFSVEYSEMVKKLKSMSSALSNMRQWFDVIIDPKLISLDFRENFDPDMYCSCLQKVILSNDPCFEPCDKHYKDSEAALRNLTNINYEHTDFWNFSNNWEIVIVSFIVMGIVFSMNHYIRGDEI